MPWPFVSRKERLRAEASEWFARLNGSEGAERRQFERWYSASPDHAEAYDRIAAVQRASTVLGQSDLARQPVLGSWAPRGGNGVRFAVAGAAIAVALIAVLLLGARELESPIAAPAQSVAYATGSGETRSVLLADGSSVELSPSSGLRVFFSNRERRVRLNRGEARFSVAHEARRFVVAAGAAEVIAHGTVFVVRLDQGRATVSLIQGSVDVSYVQSSTSRTGRSVKTLRLGEQITVPAAGQQTGAPPRTASRSTAPAHAMLEFDDTPMSDVIEEANRGGGAQLRLADPALGSLRVTGAFRVGDARAFADTLAAAFGLEVERSNDGTLLLRATPSSPSR